MVTMETRLIPARIKLEFMNERVIDRLGFMIVKKAVRYWIDGIQDYIEHGTLPADMIEARALIKRFARYYILGRILYTRSFYRPLLRWVRPKTVQGLLEEVHEEYTEAIPDPALWLIKL